jgi:hypothetical protein
VLVRAWSVLRREPLVYFVVLVKTLGGVDRDALNSPHVCYWHLTDIPARPPFVCFQG